MSASAPAEGIFIHDAGAPVDAPGRAAFDEGSSARPVLLRFLQLRSGLFALRRVCKATRSLVAEVALLDGREIRVDHVHKLYALRAAFPRSHVNLSLRVESKWSPQDVECCAKATAVSISHYVGKPLIPDACLQSMEQCRELSLSECSYTTLPTAPLQGLHKLTLQDSTMGPLPFSWSDLSALGSLVSLHLHSPRAQGVTVRDLGPALAERLTDLVLGKELRGRGGIADFRPFTSLLSLSLSCTTVDLNTLPLSLHVLRLHEVAPTTPDWAALHAMANLRELYLTSVHGAQEVCQHLPPNITTLHLCNVVPTPPWPELARTVGPSLLHLLVERTSLTGWSAVPARPGDATAPEAVFPVLQSLHWAEPGPVNGHTDLPILPQLTHLKLHHGWPSHYAPHNLHVRLVGLHRTPQLQALHMLRPEEVSFAHLLAFLTSSPPTLRRLKLLGQESTRHVTQLALDLLRALTLVHGPGTVRVWHASPADRSALGDSEGWYEAGTVWRRVLPPSPSPSMTALPGGEPDCMSGHQEIQWSILPSTAATPAGEGS